jgi:lipopolysaccharide/colanic/teichoic acid biosynthesis glycosyltransferase
MSLARARGASVYVVGRLVGPLDSSGLLLRLFRLPVMRVHHDPASGEPTGLKRAFDVCASALALIALSPLLALIAVAVKLDSRGPVLFRQERVVARGRTFAFLKFRTMAAGNDPAPHRDYVRRLIEGEEVAGVDERGEPVLKLAADPRVTRVGRLLRKYSLDELPQLWNVLRGDMSIVGPRPALSYEVAAYKDWHRRRLEAVPGLSGLWQVAGRSRVTFDEMVFQDVVYTCNQSLFTDLTICLRTVPAVLTGKGAV